MAHTQYACRRRNTGKLRIAEPMWGDKLVAFLSNSTFF